MTPLSVAATGITLKVVLERLSEKVQAAIAAAAGGAGLVIAQAARNAELLIGALKSNLSDELDKNWDKLDQQKRDALRKIDEKIAALDNIKDVIDDVHNTLYLDVRSFLDDLPFFNNTPVIREVRPANHYHLSDKSLYRSTISGTFFHDDSDITLSINGEELPHDCFVRRPPYTLEIILPSDRIERFFDDYQLHFLPIVITAILPEDGFMGMIGRRKELYFDIKIGLFPRLPIQYALMQSVRTKTLGKNLQRQPGQNKQVPPHQPATICTYVPDGAEPVSIDRAETEGTDFLRWNDKYERVPNGFCWQIWNSGDQLGLARFDVMYHPLIETSQKQPAFFRRFGDVTGEYVRYMEYGMSYVAELDMNMEDFELILTDFTGKREAASLAKSTAGYDIPALTLTTTAKRLTISPKVPW